MWQIKKSINHCWLWQVVARRAIYHWVFMKLSPVPRPPPPSEIFKHVRVWRAPVYWAAARGAIEREREVCWTACGFFLQGSLTHITHFTHTGHCRLNAPLSSAEICEGVERIPVIPRSLFDPREEEKNHIVKSVKLNSWRDVCESGHSSLNPLSEAESF